jgi:hypothetical protein
VSMDRAARAAVLLLYAPLFVSLSLSVPAHGLALRASLSWQTALSGLLTLGALYGLWSRAASVWEGTAVRLWLDALVGTLWLAALLAWGRPL